MNMQTIDTTPIIIDGRYAKDVKIFTQNCEDEAIALIYDIANNPVFEGASIRIMPDVHAGKGIVIGFTCPVTQGMPVNPSHIGVDIGCSISAIFFNGKVDPKDYELLNHKLLRAIPTGFNINEKTQFAVKEFLKFLRTELRLAYQATHGAINQISMNSERDLEHWVESVGQDLGVFYKSIGSIGGGNHFMEYDESEDGTKSAFLVHTGSRNLGQKVFKKWDKIASSSQLSKAGIKKITEETKKAYLAAGKDRQGLKAAIDEAVKEYKKTLHPGYLSGEDLRGYLTDMVICQAYAKWNHMIICEKAESIITKLSHIKIIDKIHTTHNYIDFNTVDGLPMIRKGSVRANEGERFILPFNMKDGVAICVGKGNREWNYSSPHGAGRIMSRAAAKKNINLDHFKAQMKNAGIYSTCVDATTLDEAPDAYKPMDEIVANISPTCDILFFMKPKINIKASGDCEAQYGHR